MVINFILAFVYAILAVLMLKFDDFISYSYIGDDMLMYSMVECVLNIAVCMFSSIIIIKARNIIEDEFNKFRTSTKPFFADAVVYTEFRPTMPTENNVDDSKKYFNNSNFEDPLK